MPRCWTFFFLVYLAVVVSEGRTGLDVSRLMFGFDLKCFKEKGYTFVVVRAYRTIGCFPDPDGSDTLVKASEAGFEDIDIYMSPCPVGGGIKPAASQVEEMMRSLPRNVSIRHIWLSIEYPDNWSGNYTSNQKYFEDLISSAKMHKPAGVFTSVQQWKGVMGNNYTGGSSYPLWYIHHDDKPSVSDFEPFGGWSKPTMKQYSQDSKDCVGNLNLDYS